MAGCAADKSGNFLILFLDEVGGHGFLFCLQSCRVAELQGGRVAELQGLLCYFAPLPLCPTLPNHAPC